MKIQVANQPSRLIKAFWNHTNKMVRDSNMRPLDMALIQECSQETKIAPDKSSRVLSAGREIKCESEAWRGCSRVFTQGAVTHQQVSKISEPELRGGVSAFHVRLFVCVCSERNPSKFLFLPVAVCVCVSRGCDLLSFWSLLATKSDWQKRRPPSDWNFSLISCGSHAKFGRKTACVHVGNK